MTVDALEIEDVADEKFAWPPQLAEMTDFVEDELALAFPELTPHQVRVGAMRAMVRLTREYGGTRPYVPKADAIARALRNLEVWARHDGTVDGPNGIRALAKRYDLSEVAVWSILREQRKLHRQQRDEAERAGSQAASQGL